MIDLRRINRIAFILLIGVLLNSSLIKSVHYFYIENSVSDHFAHNFVSKKIEFVKSHKKCPICSIAMIEYFFSGRQANAFRINILTSKYFFPYINTFVLQTIKKHHLRAPPVIISKR